MARLLMIITTLIGLISLTACWQVSENGGAAAPMKASNKRYVGKSKEQCSTIRFVCEKGEVYFSDKDGCGCELDKDAVNQASEDPLEEEKSASMEKAAEPENSEAAVTAGPRECSSEERSAEMCAEIYAPVCGLFDPAQIQCIRAPCAQTFSNRCEACKDKTVIATSDGDCSP